MSWFLNQNENTTVNGYSNQFWNGITTLQFAKICENIIINNIEVNNIQHIVPQDTVNKYDLLEIFKKYFKKNINIVPSLSPNKIDKRLFTIDTDMNRQLWGDKILSIEEMISDLSR